MSCPQGPSSAPPRAGHCWPVRSPFPSGGPGGLALALLTAFSLGLVGAQRDLERDRVVRAMASWGRGSEACSGPWGSGELGTAW